MTISSIPSQSVSTPTDAELLRSEMENSTDEIVRVLALIKNVVETEERPLCYALAASIEQASEILARAKLTTHPFDAGPVTDKVSALYEGIGVAVGAIDEYVRDGDYAEASKHATDVRQLAMSATLLLQVPLPPGVADGASSWDEVCRRTAERAEELRQKRGW